MSENNRDYGKYGMMRLRFLKEHRPTLCATMLSSGELSAHLLDVNARATAEVERLVSELKKINPPPHNGLSSPLAQVEWVGHMNALKAQAEEVVSRTLIYA